MVCRRLVKPEKRGATTEPKLATKRAKTNPTLPAAAKMPAEKLECKRLSKIMSNLEMATPKARERAIHLPNLKIFFK